MNHIKHLLILLLFSMLSLSCKSATKNDNKLFTQKQVDSIVASELQKTLEASAKNEASDQFYELLELKIDKVANEKFTDYSNRQDESISHYITSMGTLFAILGLFFTLLSAIVGILIPMMNNRKVEVKLDEHTKKLEESNKEMQKDRNQLEQSKQEFNKLQENMERIRDEVTELKQETHKSMIEAEKAARQSMFSEMLSRARSENEFDKKTEMFSKLIEEYQEKEFISQSYFTRGLFYFDTKKYDNAIDDFTESIKANPNNAEAYFYRGHVFEMVANRDNAVSDYTEAIRINPNFVEALYRRGNITLSPKDLQKAIELSPNHVKAYYVLGTIYENSKDYASALDIMSEGKRKARFDGDLKMINQFEKAIDKIRSKLQ